MGVVNVLAELAETDPGGRYSNRPSSEPCVDHVPLDALHLGRDADDRLTAIRMLRRFTRARCLAIDAVDVASQATSMQMPGQAGPDIEAGSRRENAVNAAMSTSMWLPPSPKCSLTMSVRTLSRWVDLILNTRLTYPRKRAVDAFAALSRLVRHQSPTRPLGPPCGRNCKRS